MRLVVRVYADNEDVGYVAAEVEGETIDTEAIFKETASAFLQSLKEHAVGLPPE